MKAQTNVLN